MDSIAQKLQQDYGTHAPILYLLLQQKKYDSYINYISQLGLTTVGGNST